MTRELPSLELRAFGTRWSVRWGRIGSLRSPDGNSSENDCFILHSLPFPESCDGAHSWPTRRGDPMACASVYENVLSLCRRTDTYGPPYSLRGRCPVCRRTHWSRRSDDPFVDDTAWHLHHVCPHGRALFPVSDTGLGRRSAVGTDFQFGAAIFGLGLASFGMATGYWLADSSDMSPTAGA